MPKDELDFFNKNFNFYYGLSNIKSLYSTGFLKPYDYFNTLYNEKFNFAFLTDHNNYLKEDSLIWESSKEQVKKFQKKREHFIPLLGFQTKTTSLGDINIINSNTYFTGVVENLNILIFWFINNKDSFSIISSPSKLLLLSHYDPLINKVIHAMELSSGNSQSHTLKDKYFFALLDMGWILGATGGLVEDRQSESFTCVVSEKLSKNDIIQAFRNRHTFFSQSKSLEVLFYINTTFMGGFLPLDSIDEKLKFTILAEDKYFKIERIDIVSNRGKTLHSLNNFSLHKIKYIIDLPIPKDNTWFVLKIHQATSKVAITSPIFL